VSPLAGHFEEGIVTGYVRAKLGTWEALSSLLSKVRSDSHLNRVALSPKRATLCGTRLLGADAGQSEVFMSFIITVYVREGIVMAADGTLTLEHTN